MSCDCEFHRMIDAWKWENPGPRSATETALTVAYWSTHCCCCGVGVPFEKWTGDALCAECESAVMKPAPSGATEEAEK